MARFKTKRQLGQLARQAAKRAKLAEPATIPEESEDNDGDASIDCDCERGNGDKSERESDSFEHINDNNEVVAEYEKDGGIAGEVDSGGDLGFDYYELDDYTEDINGQEGCVTAIVYDTEDEEKEENSEKYDDEDEKKEENDDDEEEKKSDDEEEKEETDDEEENEASEDEEETEKGDDDKELEESDDDDEEKEENDDEEENEKSEDEEEMEKGDDDEELEESDDDDEEKEENDDEEENEKSEDEEETEKGDDDEELEESDDDEEEENDRSGVGRCFYVDDSKGEERREVGEDDILEASFEENRDDSTASKRRSVPFSAINSHELYMKKEEDTHNVCGYRITDLNYIFGWITQLTLKHSEYCSNPQLQIVDEFCASMVSTIVIKCSTCENVFTGKTENPLKRNSIRKSLAWGTVVSGETFSHTEELLAHLDMPFVSHNTFNKDVDEMHIIIREAAQASMVNARKLEVTLTDRHDENGVPVSRVIVDGGWPVRSYGNKYKSRSGSAVLIGELSGKVVYADTKNNFCVQCQINERDGTNKKHVCYVNYSGTPGSMEPSIIIEGLNEVCAWGLKFWTLISDRDSVVYDRAQNNCVYGEEISKADCVNHTLKSFKKSLLALVGKSEDEAHTLLKNGIQRMYNGVKAAINYCKAQTNKELALAGLIKDILNIFNHTYGIHDNCRSYFCTKPNDPEPYQAIHNDTQLKNAIMRILENLASNAEKLMDGLTSNKAENFFSVVAKLILGKRENLCGRGSYTLRVLIAVLLYNDGYAWSRDYLPKFTGIETGKIYAKYAANRNKQRIHSANSAKRPEAKKKRYNRPAEKSYGSDILREVNPEKLQEKLREYELENSLTVVDTDMMKISKYCKGRMLQMNIPDIVNTKKDEKLEQKATNISEVAHNKKLVSKILTVSTSARDYVNSTLEDKLANPQLKIPAQYGYLCITIDGINKTGDSILLAKRKDLQNFKKKYQSLEEAASAGSSNFGFKYKQGVAIADGNIYMEAQVSMKFFEASLCFVAFVNGSNPADVVVISITLEQKYFEQKVEKKLQVFFEKYFIKQIAISDITPLCKSYKDVEVNESNTSK